MEMQKMAELAASYVNTTNRHIFLTGKAGTGKTTFLKYIVEHTHKNAVIAAPTGIAAINAGGVTLHSLLQLPFGSFIPENIPLSPTESQVNTPETLFRNSKFNASKRQLIQELELLIIDEVSMLRADLLDCIDQTLRSLRRKRNIPFGGLQILFIGDLMQLPPVVKDDERGLLSSFYKSLYFFDARALKESPPIRLELQKIFRQSDQDFIDLLNRLRQNQQSEDDIQWLNRYYNPDFDQLEESGYIHLTTHNYRADKLNNTKLQLLENPLHTFHAHIEGNFPDSMFPTSPELHLKEGAQIMFIKNDPTGEGNYFNGKIGLVSSLDEDEIWVRFEDGNEVKVDLYKWENIRYKLDHSTNEIEEAFLGSFEQYPIKLAWAVTIHKSQGLTFEKAILDLSGTFAPGQLYVALSRLTSLGGLIFSSPLPENPPPIDRTLESFNSNFEKTEELESNLESERKAFIFSSSQDAFDFEHLIKTLTYHERSFNKDENRSIKQRFLDWTQDLIKDTIPLQRVGDSFVNEVRKILMAASYLPHLEDRVHKAKNYFLDILVPLAKEVKTHRQSLKKEAKVKAYLKELEQIEDLFHKKIRLIEKLVLIVKSVNKNEPLTKEDLREMSVNQLTKGKTSPKKSSNKDKTPTAEISYQMYSSGKNIEEIAATRGLVKSTIEGHMAKYVENGVISIDDLVDSTKVKTILKEMKKGITNSGELKSALPSNFTYGEIKLVQSHHKFETGEE